MAITYYDFRLNRDEPEALTDYWALTCRSRKGRGCEDPKSWNRERRLTKRSFDMLQAPVAGGLFLGDYAGLVSADDEFVPVFAATSRFDPANRFANRFQKGKKISKNHIPQFKNHPRKRAPFRSKNRFHSSSFPQVKNKKTRRD